MKNVVAYYRVSTDAQGRSGLGLEAQRAAVAEHLSAHGCKLLAEYTEIETGKRDTLANRPELQKAIAHSKRSRATLVVAKLDRLTRSVAVLSMLHSSGVEFIACDNPFANRLTVQILAAVAEDEARRTSERTRAALAAYKARGGLLGATRPECRNLTQAGRRKGAVRAGRSVHVQAREAYTDLYPEISRLYNDGSSLRQIAEHLSRSGHTTRRGKKWNATQVRRVLIASAHDKKI